MLIQKSVYLCVHKGTSPWSILDPMDHCLVPVDLITNLYALNINLFTHLLHPVTVSEVFICLTKRKTFTAYTDILGNAFPSWRIIGCGLKWIRVITWLPITFVRFVLYCLIDLNYIPQKICWKSKLPPRGKRWSLGHTKITHRIVTCKARNCSTDQKISNVHSILQHRTLWLSTRQLVRL